MFNRSILIPSLIACAIGAPLLLTSQPSAEQQNAPSNFDSYGGLENPESSIAFLPRGGTVNAPYFRDNSQPGFGRGHGAPAGSMPNAVVGRTSGANGQMFQQTGAISFQNAPLGNNFRNQNGLVGQQANPAWQSPPTWQSRAASQPNLAQPQSSPWDQPAALSLNPSPQAQFQTELPAQFTFTPNPVGDMPALAIDSNGQTLDFAGMTPDYGAAQTVIFSGDASGPNLNAPPLEFLPVTNFAEIFRFDISPAWVKSRWERVSTSPGDAGLHGLRIALVTGTNSWDLHGSMTYFFDANQQLQRISFRGWAGDAQQLLQILTRSFGFKQQPTHLAGFYVASRRREPTGGLLMKDPPVIYRENPVQQVAIILEVNNPAGKFSLSEDFRSLIQGSQME